MTNDSKRMRRSVVRAPALLLFSLAASGCGNIAAGDPIPIPEVSEKKVVRVSETGSRESFRVTKVVGSQENIGRHTGLRSSGHSCLPRYKLTWPGRISDADALAFRRIVFEELRAAGHLVLGDPDNLFSSAKEEKADYQIAAVIQDYKINVCWRGSYGAETASGEAYYKVDWQVFSERKQEIAHKVVSQGASKQPGAVSNGARVLRHDAFRMATRNFLASEDVFGVSTAVAPSASEQTRSAPEPTTPEAPVRVRAYKTAPAMYQGGDLSYSFDFMPGGRLSGHLIDTGFHTEETETGTWKLLNRQLCTTWDRWDGGLRHCYTIPGSGPEVISSGGSGVLSGKLRFEEDPAAAAKGQTVMNRLADLASTQN